MNGFLDPLYRAQIVEALLSIDGVADADARAHEALTGVEVVGLLTVDEDSSLTPEGVMAHVRRAFPRFCWPDRVLMTFRADPGVAFRRAA